MIIEDENGEHHEILSREEQFDRILKELKEIKAILKKEEKEPIKHPFYEEQP